MTPADFANEAKTRFRFLTSEGFVGPSEDGRRLLYSSADLAVEVLYDERDGRVITIIDSFVGERNARASLPCLYVEAGLGPAQRVRETARTRHSLETALESQASALRDVLAVLVKADAASLLLKCHGR